MYVIIYTHAYKFNLLTFKENYCILCFSNRQIRRMQIAQSAEK